MIREVKILAGTAGQKLGKRIIEHLRATAVADQRTTEDDDIYSLSELTVRKFANDNTFVKIDESVREADVFLIQSSGAPVNDRLMELLITIDACRRSSAGRINAIMPYYPYSRSDKIDQPRVALTARLVADLVEAAGADRVIAMDLHADQIHGYFNIPVDHLKATTILARYIEKHFMHDLNEEERNQQWVVVSPDAGAAKRAQMFASTLGLELAVILKHRLGNNDRSEVTHVIGEVNGRNCLIFDDEIGTGGSLINAANALRNNFGVNEVIAVATHGVFSGRALKSLEEAENIRAVVVTDTLDVPDRGETRHISYNVGDQVVEEDILITKVYECSVAELFAATIRAVHMGESVTAVYERWDLVHKQGNNFSEGNVN